MKIWTILTMTGVSIWIWTSVYILVWENQDKTEQIISNSPYSDHHLERGKKTMPWELLHETANRAPVNLPTDKEALLQLINENITLKMRIQSTKWYRDFISWILEAKQVKKNVLDALFVENEIQKNPALLVKLQSTEVWRAYIRGDVLPHDIAYGEIPALTFIDEFQKNNSNTLEKIERNPFFYKNDKWDETTFSERSGIIKNTITNEEFLRKNPNILEKLEQYWYTIEDLYRGPSHLNDDIYWQKDAIISLSIQTSFYPQVWEKFWQSEIGVLYTTGKVKPREAFIYMNELMKDAGVQ